MYPWPKDPCGSLLFSRLLSVVTPLQVSLPDGFTMEVTADIEGTWPGLVFQ